MVVLVNVENFYIQKAKNSRTFLKCTAVCIYKTKFSYLLLTICVCLYIMLLV